jgi:hypothetical protein
MTPKDKQIKANRDNPTDLFIARLTC